MTVLLLHRDLPELSYEDFLKVDITKYGWIHFEVRAEGIWK